VACFGREQNQRRPCRAKVKRRRAFGIFQQRGTDFLQAKKSLAAAGGAEEKSRLHGGIFNAKTRRGKGAKEFYFVVRLGKTENPFVDSCISCSFQPDFRPRSPRRKAIYSQYLAILVWSQAVIFVSFIKKRATISSVWEIGTG